MTILQPNKKNNILNILIGLAAVLLISLIWWVITAYNSVVELNHEISVLGDKIDKAELANSDIKNKVFSLLNPTELENLVKRRGLTKDQRAQYFETDKTVSWASVLR